MIRPGLAVYERLRWYYPDLPDPRRVVSVDVDMGDAGADVPVVNVGIALLNPVQPTQPVGPLIYEQMVAERQAGVRAKQPAPGFYL